MGRMEDCIHSERRGSLDARAVTLRGLRNIIYTVIAIETVRFWRPSHQSTIVSSRSSPRAEIRFEISIDANGEPTDRATDRADGKWDLDWMEMTFKAGHVYSARNAHE